MFLNYLQRTKLKRIRVQTIQITKNIGCDYKDRGILDWITNDEKQDGKIFNEKTDNVTNIEFIVLNNRVTILITCL